MKYVDNVLLYENKQYHILKYHINKINEFIPNKNSSYDTYIFDITIDSSLYIDIDSDLSDFKFYIFVDKKTYFVYNILLDYFIDNYDISSTYIFKGFIFSDYNNLYNNDFKAAALYYKKQLLRKNKISRLF